MNCKAARLLVDSLVDGELSSSEALELRAHLGRCVDCSQEFQAVALLKAELDHLERPLVDDSFEDRMTQRVFAAVAERPKRVRYALQWSTIGAAVAIGAAALTIQTLDGQRRDSIANTEKRSTAQRDEAFVAGSDPLSGGAFLTPASYER